MDTLHLPATFSPVLTDALNPENHIMLTPHDTYTISQHWVAALEYGDETGLTDSESVELSNWLSTLPPGPHTFNYGESVEFARDDVSGLMADCVTVTVYINSTAARG